MLQDKTKEWILANIEGAECIVASERLVGGIASLIYRVTLLVDGQEQRVVLRLVTDKKWLQEEPDLILHEKSVLTLLQREAHRSQKDCNSKVNLAAPNCIAVDENGDEAGYPAVMMTELTGKVSLPSEPSEAWIEQLAAAVAAVHELQVIERDFRYYFKPYHMAGEHPKQLWSKHSELWERCERYLLKGQPQYEQCLIHRDYHPTNVLWYETELKVSGIVDWVNGCIGPAGIDVGHCRVNLVQLYGVETADRFLTAYQANRPQFKYTPYWDICSLFDFTLDGQVGVYSGWTALGFTGLTEQIVQQRLDNYLEQLVQSIG